MALQPPTGLAASYINKGTNQNIEQIKLTWIASAGDPFDKYYIYKNDVKLAEVDNTVLEYSDSSMDSNVNYVTYYVTTWLDGTTPTESPISVAISNFSLAYEDLITRLRTLLMDYPNDPRVQRWTDDHLLECLNVAIGDVNSEPPQSVYTFETLPSGWRTLVLMRAKIEAMNNRAGIEAAKAFGYSWGCVSLQIDRSAKYLAITQADWAQYNDRLHKAKLASIMITVSPKGFTDSNLPFKIRTLSPRQFRIR